MPSAKKLIANEALEKENIIFSKNLITTRNQSLETWETIDYQSMGILNEPHLFVSHKNETPHLRAG